MPGYEPHLLAALAAQAVNTKTDAPVVSALVPPRESRQSKTRSDHASGGRMNAKELLKVAVRQGWTLDANRKHPQLKCGCGKHIVTVGGTVSDHRAFKNILASLRRCPQWRRDLERV